MSLQLTTHSRALGVRRARRTSAATTRGFGLLARPTGLLLAACACGLLAAAPAGAWSVSPALLNKTAARRSTTLGSFTVVTRGSAGRRFRVVVDDLGETQAGAFTFSGATAAVHSAAPWISVSPRWFVATGQPQPVDYAISVPADATPGDHVAAISVQELPASNAGNIGVVEAIGLRETVRVPGGARSAAAITSLTGPRLSFGGPVDVSATVKNTGSTVLDFDGSDAGSTLTVGDQSTRLTGVLLPGAIRTVGVTWSDPPLLAGSQARLRINLGGGRSVSRTRETLVLPPRELCAVLIVAALLLLAWAWRRRRGQAHAPAPAS